MVRLRSFKPNEQGVTTERQRGLPLLPLLSGEYRFLQGFLRGFVLRPEFTQGALKTIYLLITITVVMASHPQLGAQQVTSQAPPRTSLPDGPGAVRYPEAEVEPENDMTDVQMESDTQSKQGNLYVLDGSVVVTYRDRIVNADHIEYDTDTGDVTATGHVHVTGGPNHEDIRASHGTMNLAKQTALFYDVTGSVGLKSKDSNTTYANSNPFLFTGRMVVRTGPEEYEIYEGTVTSCQLPNPDWLFAAGHFSVDSQKAKAQNSVFHLMNIPLLYLPYVTHPTNGEERQSGIMIPVVGDSSTKGFTVGEEFYWVMGRSADLTLGLDYFSLRGWQERATFRYKGVGQNLVMAHYSGLQDRGYVTNGIYVNQGGEDVTFLGRHDYSAQTRVVGDAEYLSSYTYREAFAENFNDAVSSDIFSVVYGVHEADGYLESVRADKYQGLKMVAVAATATTPAIPEEQVKIFHVPSLDFNTTEHEIGDSGMLWKLDASAAGLSRIQPGFSTGGLMQRFDVHPEISYPLSFGGWHLRPSLGVRDTLYSRSRETPYPPGVPVEEPNGINRADVEMQVEIRPPVLERTFDSSRVEKLFGYDLKHTIEPEVTYRYVTGVDDFLKVLRFDDVDIVSDTNELEYGMTQRLFLRPLKKRSCPVTEEEVEQQQEKERDPNRLSVKKPSGCGSREWISWRLTQKYFFDQNFGGAVIDGRRNIFDTTLNFSGIAFLTEARAISPLVSRMRMRASANLDLEWDFDLDTGAKKFTSNNVMVDAHQGNIFGQIGYARLNAPGRFYTEGVSSSVSDFNQIRFSVGYGSPTKAGLGVAASMALDLNHNASAGDGLLQFGALETTYNWDCCGLSVEVLKYELGAVRNETVEKFSLTLANIGTAGDLKRAISLF